MPGKRSGRNKAASALIGVTLVAYYVVGLALPGHAGPKDLDGDGMPNRWEVNHDLNPFEPNAAGNPDHDGLANIGEYRNRTGPHDEDDDNDGIDDGDEVKFFGLDPNNPDQNGNGLPDGDQDRDGDGIDNEDEDDGRERCLADDDDRDGDGLDNEDENEFGTGIRDSDSDGDGVDDGNEDLDGDGVDEEDDDDDLEDSCATEEENEDDDDVFASIVSYDSSTGLLTLRDVAGNSSAGTVTTDTELSWDGEHCPEDQAEEATTADLQSDTGVSEVGYFEENPSTLEEVELACSIPLV